MEQHMGTLEFEFEEEQEQLLLLAYSVIKLAAIKIYPVFK